MTTSNNNNNNNTQAESAKKPIAVGSTWSNAGSINIDLDNLMGKSNNKGPAPSMNQLKSTNTSPVKQQAGILSPVSPNSNFSFNQSNNNNNFNQFNAFQ